MTTLTPDYLLLFNVLGLKAICTFNRDIVFSFNALNRQHIIQLLTIKTNEGYKLLYLYSLLKIRIISDLVKVI